MESLFIPLLISLALGTLIGLERESLRVHQKTRTIAGVRTFIFISLWGFLTSVIAKEINIYFLFVSFGAFVATLLVGYYIYSKTLETSGLTTEIAAILVFLLTSLTLFIDVRFVLALGILVALTLSFKNAFTRLLEIVPRQAVVATVQFAVLSAVILPFLPNEYIGPWQFFNPYISWWVIVLITGISFIGYLLHLFLGNRSSVLITSGVGGMISSTAVTSSLSSLSRTSRLPVNLLHAGMVLTSSVAFIRVLIETSVISMAVFWELLIPIVTAMVIGGVFVLFLQSKNKTAPEAMIFENPFQLRSAISFGFFFVLVAFLAKVSNIFFGTQGLYVTSLFAGLVDIDAISISVSQLANASTISANQAMIAIMIALMIALMSNLWVKLGVVIIFAQKALRKVMIIYTLIITIAVILLAFFLHFLHL